MHPNYSTYRTSLSSQKFYEICFHEMQNKVNIVHRKLWDIVVPGGCTMNKSTEYGISTYTKLFDSCVAPVLDYSSGVWGFSKYNCLEAIQNRAIRIYLGVHKFAPILALQGDMGWMSTENRQYLSMLRFWNRLLKLPDNRLTKRIFIYDFYLTQSIWAWKLVFERF